MTFFGQLTDESAEAMQLLLEYYFELLEEQ